MYNPGTQVQIPADANLGSYYLLKKLAVGVSPTAFLFKKTLELIQVIMELSFILLCQLIT
jgi:hypothetical protein